MSAAHRRRAEYVGEGIRMRLGAAWDGVADYDAGTYILSFGRDTDGSAMNLTEVQAAVAIILAGLESRSLTPAKRVSSSSATPVVESSSPSKQRNRACPQQPS